MTTTFTESVELVAWDREGVAYTFVTPDEGGELTKIEIRINRELKQDQIEGIEPPKPRNPEEEPSTPSRPKAALLNSRNRSKKYRRGL